MRSHETVSETGESIRPAPARIDAQPKYQTFGAAATGGSGVLLMLQRTVGNAAVSRVIEEESPVHRVLRSGAGAPLLPDVREDMEHRLGHDFSDVRVHNDDKAHQSAQSVNALAYTVGHNVVFQRDMYDPSSGTGRLMLAHELTHVIQQRSGPVEGTPTRGGISVSDPSDHFERAAADSAERAVSLSDPAVATEAMGPSLQRHEENDENEVEGRGSFVQRQEEPNEDWEDNLPNA